MKTRFAAFAGTVRRLVGFFKCLTGHHAFEVTQALSPQSCRIACRRCNRVFAMNEDVRVVVPWDREFHRMYESHGVKIRYKDWEFRKPNASVSISGGEPGYAPREC